MARHYEGLQGGSVYAAGRDECEAPQRSTAADVTRRKAAEVAKRSADLVDRYRERLAVVTSAAPPTNTSSPMTKELIAILPPLFEDLDASLREMTRSLDALDELLSRLEV